MRFIIIRIGRGKYQLRDHKTGRGIATRKSRYDARCAARDMYDMLPSRMTLRDRERKYG